MSKIGLVLEGGAMRGVFTAGVTDYLLEQNITFPYIVGVSAGAGNAVNYTAGQIGRSKKIITHEVHESYYGLNQLIVHKKVLNLDQVVDEYALTEFPFDFDAFFSSDTHCESVVANCETGLPEYVSNYKDKEEMLLYNRASCSVPFVCQPVEIGKSHYLDGSIADSIPFQRAFDSGCDKVVIVLTRPDGGKATDYSKMKVLVDRCYKKKYPRLCDTLLNRKADYERQVAQMEEYIRQGKIWIIRPEHSTVSHFENDYEKLCQFYEYGYSLMGRRFEDLCRFMED